MSIILYICFVIITLLIHFIIFSIGQFDRKNKIENKMINNASIILEKLDSLKESGGNKMNEDVKKLASFLSKKIDVAKEEVLTEINTKFEELFNLLSEEDIEDDGLDNATEDDLEGLEDPLEEVEEAEEKKEEVAAKKEEVVTEKSEKKKGGKV